jgi:hypothetical protein
MKKTTAFWEAVAPMWTATPETPGTAKTSKKEGKRRRAQESWETAQKTGKIWAAFMSDPDTIASLFKGTSVLPEIFLKLAQTGMKSFGHLQEQWLERVDKVGDSTQAYKYEDSDIDVFGGWTELYEKEIKKFFNIPQVGLTRFYQEKMLRYVDKSNVFQVALAEFLRLLSLPMEKSYQVMQDKLTELTDEGELPEDPKAYYKMWITILEGHYMTLFQSDEYILTLNKTLTSLSEFSAVKNEILEDILNTLPVPTQTEMDALYKEIYLLKKKVKALEKKK